MRKKLVVLILAGAMAFSMAACGGSDEAEPAAEETQIEENTESKSEDAESSDSEEVTYQSILDDYTKQIQDATPGLVEEYNTESADKAGDIEALAELSNSKVEKLAEICNEGIEKMAELMLENGDDQETYEEWAGKLQDIYTEYSAQITDAYTNSATDMSTEDLLNSLESMTQEAQ